VAAKKYTLAEAGPRIDKFLNSMFTLAGFSLDFTVSEGETPHPDFENPDLMVRFTGRDVELLLSNKAELLLALEQLTMEAIGLAAAERVKKTRVPFHFSPMNSRERRILHLALRGETEVRSESVGEGPIRQVVIVPADLKTLPEPIRPPRPRPEGPPSGRPGYGDRGRDRRDGRRDGPRGRDFRRG